MAKVSSVMARRRRHLRTRARLEGSSSRPRLSVYRSSRHIYAQLIDDEQGRTLLAASTVDPEVRGSLADKTKQEAAREVGQLLAKRALAAGIKAVRFDRGGNLYHGRVAALADGAREGGLQF